MSSSNTPIKKQSLKVLEVPLNKFREEVIPHHQQVFAEYKVLVQKVTSNSLKFHALHNDNFIVNRS